MPRKVLDVRKECVRLSCQRQTKSPSGLSVGGLFAYRHAPQRLGSRTPWNKSSALLLDTHYKSEIFKSVILSVLYYIRHFNVFVVKRKTLTFVKVEIRETTFQYLILFVFIAEIFDCNVHYKTLAFIRYENLGFNPRFSESEAISRFFGQKRYH